MEKIRSNTCFPGGVRFCSSAGELLSIATRCMALMRFWQRYAYLGRVDTLRCGLLNLGGDILGTELPQSCTGQPHFFHILILEARWASAERERERER